MTEQQAPPREVTVIGAGRMGAGIAYAFLRVGSFVRIRDVDRASIDRGTRAIELSVRRATDAGEAILGAPLDHLDAQEGLAGIQDSDLVIEAVPELLDLKRDVLQRAAEQVPETAVLASNTSSISISALGQALPSPERLVGMHFFNPVPVSKLVEVVRGTHSAPDTVARAVAWVESIGKTAITVHDAPGFATSRLGVAIGLEAIRMVEEGVATATEIDTGMMLGYGFPIGPLRLTDIVGLDVRLEIARYLESTLGNRFTPPELLRQHVAAGELGRKTGRGFYEWDPA